MQYQQQDVIDAVKAGRRTEAEAILSYLIEQALPNDPQLLMLGGIALSLGEVDLCVQALGKFRQSSSMELNHLIQAAGLYAEAGQLTKAIAIVQPQAEKKLPYPAIYHLLGTVKAQIGRLAEARLDLIQALTLSPHLGVSWFTLASLINFSRQPPVLAQLQQCYRRFGEPSIASEPAEPNAAKQEAADSYLHYAMAKAYSDLGQHAEAWQTYQRGASMQLARSLYDAAEHDRYVSAVIDNFTAEAVAQMPVNLASTTTPVAILGLPRSGTTLLGQMLSCHPQVAGAAELTAMPVAIMHLTRQQHSEFPHFIRQHGDPQSGIEHLAQVYQRISAQRIPAPGMVVDKGLTLTQHFGIWRQMFPGGKAVFIRRNDEDVAWSCFKSHFRSQADWSWSPEHIAEYMQNERRLMAHWLSLYPEQILQVDYERLVREPEQVLRQICQHLGMAFDPAMLQFHQSTSPVLTSSLGQVHQPLFQRESTAAQQYPEFFSRWRHRMQQIAASRAS